MGTKTQKLSNVVDQIVQWQSVFTGDGSTGLTAVAGRGYFIDTTSGTVTVTLPASPKIGDTISVNDYAGTFGTNNVTLDRNGNNIKGSAANETLSTSDGAYTYVYIDGTQGWKTSTTTDDLPNYVTATGGTVTTSGDYKIHQFTGDGSFVVSSGGNDSGSNTVDYLVVAGGGGGGNSNGGGGGAGGFRMASSLPINVTTYPVTVGGGGSGMVAGTPDACGPANPGSNSVFSTITSTGGGGGGSGAGGSNPGKNGAPGGSGGGGGTNFGAGGAGNTPPVSPAQGFLGGTGAGPGSPVPSQGGGGGGGATAQGVDAPGTVPGGNAGPGGAGGDATPIFGAAPQPYYLTNSPLNGAVACGVFAGGGGGGAGTTAPITKGVGGSGGGGNGGDPSTPLTGSGIAGIANSGGGGGGSKGPSPSPSTVGGTGGSGIVIIRYKFQN